jgi:hypothetical protein
MKPSYRVVFLQRRSELLAELFLQRLDPASLVRSTADLGYDFLITFKNRMGGTNTFGVEVKGTDSEVAPSLVVDKKLHERLTLSNIPGFLLVADVKRNILFYGWPNREDRRIPLRELDDRTARELRKQLVDWRH